MPRSARRRSAPSSPAKSRATTTSPRQTRRSQQTQNEPSVKESGATPAYQQRQLASINEDEDTITVKAKTRRTGGADELDNASVDADEVDRSSLTAESQSVDSGDSDELAKIDKDLIIDNLEALNQDSQGLLSLFSSTSVSGDIDEVQDPSSRKSKRLRNFLHRLHTDAEPYGRGPRLFLPASRILRALAKDTSSIPGIETILLRANLAVFISTLVSEGSNGENDQLSDLLQYLTLPNSFPHTFVELHTDFDALDENFLGETVKLGLSILTQSFIDHAERLKTGSDFDPESLLDSIFSDEEGIVADMSLGDLSATSASSIRKLASRRMREIRRFIRRTENGTVDTVGLRHKFTWRSFVEQSVSWAASRDEHIGQKLTEYGGVEAIKRTLEGFTAAVELGDEEAEDTSEGEREEQALEEGTAYLRELDERLDAADEEGESDQGPQSQSQMLRHERIVDNTKDQRKRGHRTSQSPNVAKSTYRETIPESPQVQPLQAEDLEDQHDEQQNNIDGVQDNLADNLSSVEQDAPNSAQAPQPTQETLDVLNVTRRQERESNKENSPPRLRLRLTDRQPNAEKISWGDDSQAVSQNRQKRRRDEIDISEDEDAFESDTRQAKRPRPQTGKAPALDRPQQEKTASPMFFTDTEELQVAPSRKATRQPVHAGSSRRSRTPSVQPESSRARQISRADEGRTVPAAPSPTRSPPQNTLPASSYEGYLEVKQKAQKNLRLASLIAASSSAGQPFRSTQVRKAWTADEIRRLMDLMEEFGTSWAKIKEADSNFAVPLLENRSQVQLKDKARNMKLDFLKAEQPLPDYFDGVTISKSHREQLRRMNIGLPRDTLEEE